RRQSCRRGAGRSAMKRAFAWLIRPCLGAGPFCPAARPGRAERPDPHHDGLTGGCHLVAATSRISFTGVPSFGNKALLVSSFRYFSSFIVKLVCRTVSSVTGKMAI